MGSSGYYRGKHRPGSGEPPSCQADLAAARSGNNRALSRLLPQGAESFFGAWVDFIKPFKIN
jgi:hypothetical protein